tara:strand:+ start:1762 stop:1923 length:162 start_codon:yes stop_codon:yes gene_type:complete
MEATLTPNSNPTNIPLNKIEDSYIGTTTLDLPLALVAKVNPSSIGLLTLTFEL